MRALAWNTGVQLAGKVVSTLLGIFVVGLMTRELGQQGFGAYSYATAFLQIFALILDLGMNVTLIAMLGENAGDEPAQRKIVSSFFTLRLIMAVVIFLLIAPLTVWVMPYDLTLKFAILALTGSFFFPALNQVVIGVQQQKLEMYISAIGEVIGRVVLLGGLMYARNTSISIVGVMLFVSLAACVNFLFSFLLTRKQSDFRWKWDPAFWKHILGRSWPIGVSIAFNLVYFKADTLILKHFRPLAEVGIYGAAYRVLELLITVPFMYAGVLLPILAQSWKQQDKQAFAQFVSRSVDLMMLIVAPIIAMTYALGTSLMIAVAGPEFAASGTVLKILVLAVGVIYINVIFSHGIVALDAQRKMLPVYITVAVVTLAGYILFIPDYGMWAAAWLTVFSETCVTLGSIVFTLRATPVPFHKRTAVVSIVAAIGMGLVASFLHTYWLPIPILAGSIVYVGLVLALGGVSRETLKDILSLKKQSAPLL